MFVDIWDSAILYKQTWDFFEKILVTKKLITNISLCAHELMSNYGT
jgi:hypothetical protein